MRKLLFTVSLFAFSALSHAADTVPAPLAKTPQVRNIAPAFGDFWDRTRDLPMPQRVAEFKKQVAAQFPEFYGIERYAGRRTQAEQDKRIERAIENFPAMRSEYARKAQQFEAELPRYMASFRTRFPDYRQTTDIYVLHSLGEMDGGPREFGGRAYLVFGVDGMVQYHGSGNEAAFFHHELFHTYHKAMLGDCEDERIWSYLWREGLATYVAKVLNPGANDRELLLDFPEGMAVRTRANLAASLKQLEQVLDSEDSAMGAELFQVRADAVTGLPIRRGYYLGYLVAQEAATSRSVGELAKLDCRTARETVFSAIQALRAH